MKSLNLKRDKESSCPNEQRIADLEFSQILLKQHYDDLSKEFIELKEIFSKVTENIGSHHAQAQYSSTMESMAVQMKETIDADVIDENLTSFPGWPGAGGL